MFQNIFTVLCSRWSSSAPSTSSTTGLKQGFLLAFLFVLLVVPLTVFYVEPSLKNVGRNVSSVQQQVAALEKATTDLKAQAGRHLPANEMQKIEELIREANKAQATLQQREANNAIAQAEMIRLSEQAAGAAESLKSFRKIISVRTSKLKALATSDSGRKIVADHNRLRLLVTVIDSQHANEAKIVAWEQRLGLLRETMQKALSPKNPSDVGSAIGDSVTRLVAEIDQAASRLQDELWLIDRLTIESRAATPVTTTAEDAVTAYRQQQAAERVSVIEEARRNAQHDQTKSFAEAEAQRVEAEGQVKRQELENDTARLKARELELALIGSTEAQARAKALARDKLEAEAKADAAEINQVLAPFITNSSQQLNNFGFTSGTNGPLSLGSIKGRGALDTTDAGLEMLYWIGGDYANRRPHGSFPPYSNFALKQNPSIKEKVRRAQQLLIKYGDYLVEKGFLAP